MYLGIVCGLGTRFSFFMIFEFHFFGGSRFEENFGGFFQEF